ncbi:MAG TPA: fibronectin/fibrinogen-binding protein [Mogibacterium sp.]|nr:fibronectin/fibrinogen-binding protein [Mogibacterium sp.]
MAYDGIITYAITKELNEKIPLSKIEKIYQPGSEELLIHLHTKKGNFRLFISCNSRSARVCLTEKKYENPDKPPMFCMLLRKHLQGGKITEIRQKDSERIIEFDIETYNELGVITCKRLIVEIMSRHSHIILVDTVSGKVIDSIKRISIDVNRYRQLLPGVEYKYPPAQDKIPFKDVRPDTLLPHDEKAIMSTVAGISPAIAREILSCSTDIPDASVKSVQPAIRLCEIIESIDKGNCKPVIYLDKNNSPIEFHLTDLKEYEELNTLNFTTINKCVEHFYFDRDISTVLQQKILPLTKTVNAAISKAQLKKQKLNEDLLKAENSDKYQLYGELITANIHLIKPGDKIARVTNYYDGNPIDIPLDEKLNAAKNAQRYFRKYSKAKTAIYEKQVQINDNDNDLLYLESVLQNIEIADTNAKLDVIREELREAGYLRKYTKLSKNRKKTKPDPTKYTLSDGTTVLVGQNNIENDYLTTKLADKTDIWMHTKDIPGSHLIVKLKPGRTIDDVPAKIIYEAASIAAYYSKSRDSENVPVDYVPVRHVKKPKGAKPGMVIFTNNQTVYVSPKLPEDTKEAKLK